MNFIQDYQNILQNNNNTIIINIILVVIIFIFLSTIIMKILINYQDVNLQKIHFYNYNLNTWAIITGATDGIGLEFAKKFYDNNWNLILVSRNENKLESVILQYFSNPKKINTVVGYKLDYSNCKPEDFDLFYEHQLKNKEITVLINNIGTGYSLEYMHLINKQLIINTCKVNIESTIFMTQIVLKRMLQTSKKKIILNISSASGLLNTSPLISIYGASKAFINHWTASMNTEYENNNILFEVLTPFYITTKLSGYTEESLFIPSPKTYVEYAMHLIGNGLLIHTGYYVHTLLLHLLKCLPLKYRSKYIFNAYNKFKKNKKI